MFAITKPGKAVSGKKKIPPPGRKMTRQEARDYVFKTYAAAMALLAKH